MSTSDSAPCTPAAAAARKVNTGSLISLSNGSAPAVLAQLLKKSKTFSNFFADCIYMGAVHKGSKGTKSIARYSADVASLNARWISNNRPPSAPTVGKTHKTITTCPGLYKACEAFLTKGLDAGGKSKDDGSEHTEQTVEYKMVEKCKQVIEIQNIFNKQLEKAKETEATIKQRLNMSDWSCSCGSCRCTRTRSSH